jgi:O-antigen biosynthesis protein
VAGISEDYVVGDFEDSDFSLKIVRSGKELRYEPSAELFHYERQSIVQNDSYTKTRACGYNRWLHTQRWRSELERLTGDSDRTSERLTLVL